MWLENFFKLTFLKFQSQLSRWQHFPYFIDSCSLHQVLIHRCFDAFAIIVV